MGCLTVTAIQASENINVSASRYGDGLIMSCALVCSIKEIQTGDTIVIDIPESSVGQGHEGYLFLNEENGFSGVVNITTDTDWWVE